MHKLLSDTVGGWGGWNGRGVWNTADYISALQAQEGHFLWEYTNTVKLGLVLEELQVSPMFATPSVRNFGTTSYPGSCEEGEGVPLPPPDSLNMRLAAILVHRLCTDVRECLQDWVCDFQECQSCGESHFSTRGPAHSGWKVD